MSAPTTVQPAPAHERGAPGGVMVPGAPSVPQVNLLPPEIRGSRSLARLKRLLLLVLLLVVVLAGMGYVWSTWQVSAAQDALAEQEAETQRLLAAQKEYAEVPQVLGALDATKEARTLGTTTEVMWAPYLTALVATAPEGIAFESIQMTGATPTMPAGLPTNPLQAVAPSTLTFTGRSLVVPNTSEWIEQLESIENLTDAYVTSLAITEEDVDGTKTSYYEVTGSVQVTEAAFALRYAEQAEQEEG